MPFIYTSKLPLTFVLKEIKTATKLALWSCLLILKLPRATTNKQHPNSSYYYMDFDIYRTYNGQRVYDDVNYKSFREYQTRHPQPLIATTKSIASTAPTSASSAFMKELNEALGPSISDRMRQSFETRDSSMRDTRLYHTFTNFTIYNSLQEIFHEWPEISKGVLEVKFLEPNSLDGWQSVVYRCATMVKVLKTLGCLMEANSKEYKFSYENKFLYKPTTYQFNYDPSNYRFTVKTGQVLSQRDAKNWLLSLHASALGQLHSLLSTMRYKLPQVHFEKAYDLYVLIKDKPTAKLR